MNLLFGYLIFVDDLREYKKSIPLRSRSSSGILRSRNNSSLRIKLSTQSLNKESISLINESCPSKTRPRPTSWTTTQTRLTSKTYYTPRSEPTLIKRKIRLIKQCLNTQKWKLLNGSRISSTKIKSLFLKAYNSKSNFILHVYVVTWNL